ncbi:helix-turn-helix transcriptional regulator [Nocardioides sp. NPDC004968]|uniref:helix-turn-helix transcriptional regulator n=1 Tax=Nocardioides sp. NPDC004968 TaxID=3155894 RepID=UPI0033A74AB2
MSKTKAGTHRPLPTTTAQTLASRLRYLREQAGLTQEQVAGSADVSVQMVRRLEAGTANPTLGTLHAVTTALDIAWTDLFIEIK